MSYAVGTIVQNTRTGEYGIITSSGGFSPLTGTPPYSSNVPRIYFPPGSAGTVDTTSSNSQPNVWGGIDPMGAGIAGVNTRSRKFGGGRPGQKTTTSGGIEVTKAQKRDARNIRNEFDLKEGDYIWDQNSDIVWIVKEKGIEAVGEIPGPTRLEDGTTIYGQSIGDVRDWEIGDRVFSANKIQNEDGTFVYETVYSEYDPESDETGLNPWSLINNDEESTEDSDTDVPPTDSPFPSIVLDDGTIINPPVVPDRKSVV